MKIYKYPLKITDQQDIEMPEGADIICVQMQQEHPYLWAIVDEEAQTEIRTLRVIGTGHPVTDFYQLTYIGTIQQADGGLIWHVFDKIKP